MAMTCRSPANQENKGYGLGLTWAGMEARPTKKDPNRFFPETGNLKPVIMSLRLTQYHENSGCQEPSAHPGCQTFSGQKPSRNSKLETLFSDSLVSGTKIE
jgi:hypothetical protein